MKDPCRPGNIQGVPGTPDDAARAKAFRAREETYHRSKLPEVREAKNFLYHLENVLSQPETEARARYLITHAVASELRDQVLQIVKAEVSKLIVEGTIMVDMRHLPCGFKTVSFSANNPEFEEDLAAWFLSLTVDVLDLRYQPKRK